MWSNLVLEVRDASAVCSRTPKNTMGSINQFWEAQEEERENLIVPTVKRLCYGEQMFNVLSDEGSVVKVVGRGAKGGDIIVFAVVKTTVKVSSSSEPMYIVSPSEKDFVVNRCPLVPITCPKDTTPLMKALNDIQ